MTVQATPPAVMWTFNDIDVGARLVEALVAHGQAAPVVPVGYAALLAQARAMYPRDAVLGRAVPVGIGPKLVLVAAFCQLHGYPNLAALAVDDVTGAPGPHATEPVNAHAVGQADWSAAVAQLAGDVKTWRAAVPARIKPRAERPADVAWYAWFRTHRAECAGVTAEGKIEIINLVMAGLDPEAALRRVLAAQVDYGPGVRA